MGKNGQSAVGVAAAIHLVDSLPSRAFIEFNVGNALIEEAIDRPFRLDTYGCLSVPETPGLGVNVLRGCVRTWKSSGYSSPSWTWDE